MDLYDVRMMQRRNSASFSLETHHEIGVVSQISADQLDCDVPMQLRVKGLPDLGHASVPYMFLQLVFSYASWSCIHLTPSLCVRSDIKGCQALDPIVDLYSASLYSVSRLSNLTNKSGIGLS